VRLFHGTASKKADCLIMSGIIASGTLAASGHRYILQASTFGGGKYEVVVFDKQAELLSKFFEPTTDGYVQCRKWLDSLQELVPPEIRKLAAERPER
jgi:hypothetical protein